MKIFYTVNEGLFLLDEKSGHGLLVDGIHRGSALGFSDTPESLLRYMTEKKGICSHVDALVFTHPHEDHYAPDMIPDIYRDKVHLAWEMAEGDLTLSPAALTGSAEKAEKSGAVRPKMTIFRTRHEGEAYREVPHASLFIRLGGKTVFLPADADLISCRENIPSGKKADYLFLNPYQALSPVCEAYLRELSPERVFLYHRPYRIYPGSAYDNLARLAVRRYPISLPELEEIPPMTWIEN